MPRKLQITAPNGKQFEIEAPDDATDAEIEAAAREASGVAPDYGVQNNASSGLAQDPEDELFSAIGTGVAEIGKGVAQGVGNVVDHAAGWVQSGINAAGSLVGAPDAGDRLSRGFGDNVGLANQFGAPEPGFELPRGVGEFVGNVSGTLPLAALGGGAVFQGAAGGALLSDSDTAAGVIGDAVMGGVAGKVGESAFRGASRLANPQLEGNLRTLIDAGVRTSPGQSARAGTGFANRMAAAAEDKATSLPGVGEMIARDRNVSNQSFQVAAINRALNPIGDAVPANLGAGRRAIRYAGDKLSAAYDDLLPQLSVTGDQQFANDLAAIHSDAADMLPARTEQFNNILRGLGRYWQDGVSLDGRALKDIETRVGEKARRFARSQDADQQELGDALEGILQSVRNLAARQNPEAADRLRAINTGWKSLTQVERAGLSTKGEFTPAGYSQAVRNSSDTTRRRGYARGEALNQDLSDAASDVLPSEIPDSGTGARWAQANIPALALGVAGTVPYAAARGVNRLGTRQNYLAPNLSRLLEYGSRYAPIAAPAAVASLRSEGP